MWELQHDEIVFCDLCQFVGPVSYKASWTPLSDELHRDVWLDSELQVAMWCGLVGDSKAVDLLAQHQITSFVT